MPPQIDILIGTLEAEVPAAMERLRIPGAAVGICDADGILWSAGFGETARDGGAPVTAATAFSVQSTSKLFTATLVLALARQGVVDLDEPIRTYLPELTVRSAFEEDPVAAITLRHLLAHTAGFTHEAPLGSNSDPGDGDFDAHCRSIYDTWLRFPVGHHHEYSNLGIDLAGFALERVTGTPFPELAQQHLLAPLGLTRSSFDAVTIVADRDRAIGHWRPFEEAGLPTPVEVPMVPSGALYASVGDLLRLASCLLRGGAPLLTPELAVEQLQVQFPLPGQRLGYGLGVYVDEWAPGLPVYHHGGSGFGFQAQLCWVPDLGVGVAVLTNTFEQSLPNDLAHSIVSRLAGEEQPVINRAATPVEADRPEPGAVAELVGEYVGRIGTPLRVLLEDGRLVVGDERRPARMVDPLTIEIDGPVPERHRFGAGTAGPATYMLALRDGTAHYRNDPPWGAGSTLDPGHAGTYVALARGLPLGRYRLAQEGRSPVIDILSTDPTDPALTLRLAPLEPGLYISSMGEVLDLRGPLPTYANIALTKVEEAA